MNRSNAAMQVSRNAGGLEAHHAGSEPQYKIVNPLNPGTFLAVFQDYVDALSRYSVTRSAEKTVMADAGRFRLIRSLLPVSNTGTLCWAVLLVLNAFLCKQFLFLQRISLSPGSVCLVSSFFFLISLYPFLVEIRFLWCVVRDQFRRGVVASEVLCLGMVGSASLYELITIISFPDRLRTATVVALPVALLLSVLQRLCFVRWMKPFVQILDDGLAWTGEDKELVPAVGVSALSTRQYRAGDSICSDGVVVSGLALVNECYLFEPVEILQKCEGDQIFAGSKLLHGSLVVRDLNLPHESSIASVWPFVENAVGGALPGVSDAEKRLSFMLQLFVPFALAGAIWGLIFAMPAGAVLISLSAVFAILSLLRFGLLLPSWASLTIRQATKRGFIADSLATILQVSKTKQAVVCLNSERSDSRPVVDLLELLDDEVSGQVVTNVILALASCVDSRFYREALRHCLDRFPKVTLLQLENVHHYAGRGICGSTQGIEVSLGSEQFLIDRGVYVQQSDVGTGSVVDDAPRGSSVFLSINDAVVARIRFADSLVGTIESSADFFRSRGGGLSVCHLELGAIGKPQLPGLGGGKESYSASQRLDIKAFQERYLPVIEEGSSVSKLFVFDTSLTDVFTEDLVLDTIVGAASKNRIMLLPFSLLNAFGSLGKSIPPHTVVTFGDVMTNLCALAAPVKSDYFWNRLAVVPVMGLAVFSALATVVGKLPPGIACLILLAGLGVIELRHRLKR